MNANIHIFKFLKVYLHIEKNLTIHVRLHLIKSELDIKLSEPWKSNKFFCGVLKSEISFQTTKLVYNVQKFKMKLSESLKCRTDSPASCKSQI